ncbi:fibronectin type III domain-containing protein [Paractinoplanes globisporus]|uniref:Fibronectin type III domain-containing protein n=1 Tax=Paractinoplanes globisporus TaxID=113565 RepID=A0ABW6WHZ6_9ACTN|nr:fibronectin type III domain-containing protein [Actinoplanes globisporus]
MVRSHRRRFGAALLATVLCGMLAVVDTPPAVAVVPTGDLTEVAVYTVSFSGDVMRVGPDGTVTFPATGLTPLGQGIAAAPDGTLYVSSPPNDTVWKIAPGGSPAAVPFTATVDSPQDIAVDDTGALYTVSTGTGKVIKRATNGTEAEIPFTAAIVSAMAVDHDGSHIYLLDVMNGEIVRMDADGGNRTVVVGFNDIHNIQAITVDDQQRVYAGTVDGHIYRITQGPGPRTIDDLTSAAGNITDVAVADNGEVFATRFTSADVVRVHTDGSVEQVLDQVPSPIGLLVRTVPAPPATVTATAGAGSADVEWDTGQTNGGSPIVRYTAVSDPGGLTCTPIVPADTHCTVTGLTNGQAYTFKVVASTTMGGDGESLLSPASGPVTPSLPSPSPSPSTTSPSPAPSTISPTTPPITLPSPSPSTTSASPSPSPTPTPTSTVPNPPTGVTATAATSSIEVSWQRPADNGVAITGYRAIADPGPALCTTTGATTCVLGGTAGTSYRVRVVALSAKGTSKLSAYSNAAVPTAPTVATTPPVTSVPLNTDQGQISTAAPGQSVTLVGEGYAAYSTVTLTIYSTPVVLATIATDKNGAFSKTVTVPADLASGKHAFTATGVDPSGKPRAMRLDVTVQPEPSRLPVTGTAVMWLVVTGLGMTIAGAGLRLASGAERTKSGL